MGVHISLGDYRRIKRLLTKPASLVSTRRFERTIESALFGEPIQFIHKYTDPQRLLVIIGERLIKALLRIP